MWYDELLYLYRKIGSLAGIARELGVSGRTVGRWIKRQAEPRDINKEKIRELYERYLEAWLVLYSMNGVYPVKPREIECKMLLKVPDELVNSGDVFDFARDLCLLYYEKKGYTDFIYADETDIYFGQMRVEKVEKADGELMIEIHDFKRGLCPFSDIVDIGDEWYEDLVEAKRRFLNEVADYTGARGRGASNVSKCVVSDYLSEREEHAGD